MKISMTLIAVISIALASSGIAADAKKPVQVLIVAFLDGFDVGTAMYPQSSAAGRTKSLQLPRVTTPFGAPVEIRMIREFRHPVDFDAVGKPAAFGTSDLGVTLVIKPYIQKGMVNYSGKLTLATAPGLDRKPVSWIPAVVTSTKWISGSAKPGVPVSFHSVSPDGKPVVLKIIFLLMDAEGHPALKR